MNTNLHQEELLEVQAAIYRVALSLDSFLMNGISFGVVHQPVFQGLLQQTAATLECELAALEAQVAHIATDSPPGAGDVAGALRASCQQLIDSVTGLRSFRTLPPQQLRVAVDQILSLRGQCVRLIQELEGQLGTPKPFYATRPGHSTAAVNDFLAGLEQTLVDAKAAPESKE